MRNDMLSPAAVGVAGALALLAPYLGLLPLVTNWSFTLAQFGIYWPFITSLATGFGVQVALFIYLRRLVRGCPAHGKVVAVYYFHDQPRSDRYIAATLWTPPAPTGGRAR